MRLRDLANTMVDDPNPLYIVCPEMELSCVHSGKYGCCYMTHHELCFHYQKRNGIHNLRSAEELLDYEENLRRRTLKPLDDLDNRGGLA